MSKKEFRSVIENELELLWQTENIGDNIKAQYEWFEQRKNDLDIPEADIKVFEDYFLHKADSLAMTGGST